MDAGWGALVLQVSTAVVVSCIVGIVAAVVAAGKASAVFSVKLEGLERRADGLEKKLEVLDTRYATKERVDAQEQLFKQALGHLEEGLRRVNESMKDLEDRL